MNRKETFFDYKNKIFTTSQKWHFPKGVINPCFWSKMTLFSLFVSVKTRLQIKLTDFVEKKETFFDYKN